MVQLRVERMFAGRTLSALILALPLFSPEQAIGQEAISLERVVTLARERAPAIAAARARVIQATGQRRESSVPPDPSLSLGRGRGKPRDGGASASESQFQVEQFLPSPWGVRARWRSGTSAIEATNRDVDTVIAEVGLEAKRLYYEAAVGEAQSRALGEAAKDAQSLREIMDRRVELGEANEGDRLRTRVEALRADLEARTGRAQAAAARAELNRFLLGALGSEFTLSTDLDPTRLTSTPDGFLSLVVSRNPEYRAAVARAEAARWSLSAERASRLPGLSLSYSREKELDRTAHGLALGLTVPLWNRNEGAVLVARGELDEAAAQALEVKAQIEAAAERLVRVSEAAREAAVAYRQEILPAAAEALAIKRFSLEQGEANLLAWLEARRSYLEVLRGSYQAQLEAFLRNAELERLTGGFDAGR